MRSLILLVSLILFSYFSFAQEIDVLIKGFDDGVKTTKQQDYNEAVVSAKLQAIERVGESIKKYTEVENFELKTQIVNTKSEGILVPGYEILDLGYQADGTYLVVLNGKVRTSDFKKFINVSFKFNGIKFHDEKYIKDFDVNILSQDNEKLATFSIDKDSDGFKKVIFKAPSDTKSVYLSMPKVLWNLYLFEEKKVFIPDPKFGHTIKLPFSEDIQFQALTLSLLPTTTVVYKNYVRGSGSSLKYIELDRKEHIAKLETYWNKETGCWSCQFVLEVTVSIDGKEVYNVLREKVDVDNLNNSYLNRVFNKSFKDQFGNKWDVLVKTDEYPYDDTPVITLQMAERRFMDDFEQIKQ